MNESTFPTETVVWVVVLTAAVVLAWFVTPKVRRWLVLRRFRAHMAQKIGAEGGLEGFLDHIGRETLTVWIPLDHDITDSDRQFARRLADLLPEHVPREIARNHGIASELHKVGVTVAGRDPEIMLEGIRPFFQQHCPRGSFVTRYRIARSDELDGSDTVGRWPQPRLLFEDDQITESTSSSE